MELGRMDVNKDLVRRVQHIATGADIHKLNGLLNAYVLSVSVFNDHIKNGRVEQSELQIEVVEQCIKRLEEIAVKARTKRLQDKRVA